MSNRTLLEFNHDYTPRDNEAEIVEWARSLRTYLTTGDDEFLPDGVLRLGFRHHSDPEFLAQARQQAVAEMQEHVIKVAKANELWADKALELEDLADAERYKYGLTIARRIYDELRSLTPPPALTKEK